MRRAGLDEEIATVRDLCRDLGYGNVAPTLLAAAHHTTLLIAPLAIVARVQSAEPLDVARRTAVREIAVARHLTARSAPGLAPLDHAGPYVTATAVATLWPHVAPARTAVASDAPSSAATLVAIHDGLSDYDGALPPYTAALDRCWSVLTDGAAAAALERTDRRLLETQFQHLRGEVAALAEPPVALHGDVHLGNLLVGPRGAVWTDFEDACRGPREIDLAGLPPATWARFATADRALIRRCAALRSVTVAVWCSADRERSPKHRAAADYHLHRVRRLARTRSTA